MGLSKAMKQALADSGYVKVVYCQNCYWWTKQTNSSQGLCSKLQFYLPGTFYCADGETTKQRKERMKQNAVD